MPHRVAVVAIHGVGHHEPRESACATADLLVFANPKAYSPFVEAPLRVPVVRVDPGAHQSQAPRGFEERPDFVNRAVEQSAQAVKTVRSQAKSKGAKATSAEEAAAIVTPASPEIQYMREQLGKYWPEGDDRVYESVSLTSTREEGGKETEVHVFDMYWTDISRVKTTGLRLIGELYQLLFYVAGLGRHTLDFALAANPTTFKWRALAWMQKQAERLLVLWIPVFNLCGLGLGVVVIPQRIYELQSRRGSIWATASVLLIVLFLGAAIATRYYRPGVSWPALFWTAILGGPVIALGVYPLKDIMPIVLALAFWLVAAALILALMFVYNKRRPGAVFAGLVSTILVVLMLLCPVVQDKVGPDNIQELGLRAGWWIYIILHYLWAAFIVLALCISFLGLWAAYRPKAVSEDKRAVWTANLSLAVPGLLSLVLNLGLWQGALKLSEKFLDAGTAQRIRGILELSTPWSFAVVLALALLALLSVVWSLLPSVLGEIFPKTAAKRPAEPLGVGLSSGFRYMRVAGEIVRWIFVLGLPVSLLLRDWDLVPRKYVELLAPISGESTFWVGLLLIAMIAGPGPLRALAMGLRVAVDIAIDVANWLRMHPREQNPRARICARYTSLLRNILSYRGRDEKGFDRIVIFSHSQGTVISAEMLRFLLLNGDPLSAELSQRELVLFTMGCPLRQLYSQRFPLQYGWARHEDKRWPGRCPDPDETGVARWVNAYRSGDYVGRHLWYPDDAEAWDTKPKSDPRRVEVCIGAGAHTHYWDDSAPEVAKMLDDLVSGERAGKK